MIRLVSIIPGVCARLKTCQLREGLDQEYTLLPKSLPDVESLAFGFFLSKMNAPDSLISISTFRAEASDSAVHFLVEKTHASYRSFFLEGSHPARLVEP